MLKTRLTPHVRSTLVTGVQNYQFPAKNKLDYELQIVCVLQNSVYYSAFNVIMSDGSRGKLKYTEQVEILKKKKQNKVAKIVIY